MKKPTVIEFVRLAALTALFAASVPAQAQSVSKARMSLHTSAGSCVSCDLSGKNLPYMTMRDANFSGSSFKRTNLSGGNLDSSNLSQTQFQKAFLARVKGNRVNFSRSKMQDVTLVEAEITRSIMTGADLRRADLARGIFSVTNFNNADLTSASAPNANFEGSHFIGARFDHANLQEAQLDKGLFHKVKFGNAVMNGASMVGADFSGADLSRAQGLKQAQLDTACGDPYTDVPPGFSMPYCHKIDPANKRSHDHSRMTPEQTLAAKRLNNAAIDLEDLLASPVESEKKLRRRLEKIHSQINAARRDLER